MEQWKDLIYQHKNYGERLEVSTQGRMRNKITGHIYKLNKNKNGYLCVCISLGSRENKMLFRIHRAVAETFIPNPNDLPEVNHLNGNKEENTTWNLEWANGKTNMRHAVIMGIQKAPRGTNNGNSILTQEDIRYIRNNYKANSKEFGCRALAKKFNVDHSTISRIINGKTYKNK